MTRMNLLHVNDRAGEYPPSYYAATRADFPRLPPLLGAQRADVCIVGAGYTGLSAALHLAQRGYSVIVLEAQRVGFGASGRNGGQVGSGQRQDQIWLEKTVGREDAHRMWALAEDAKTLVKDLISHHNMPVTFYPGVAHACWSEAEVRDTHAYAEKLHRDYGYDQLEPLNRTGIQRLIGSKAYKGGEVDRGAGHVHPLNYAIGLAQAAQKLEGAGAEALVLCTNTMHKVANAIESAVQIPLLHIADPTAMQIRQAGLSTVGLLGTCFTMEQPFYKDRLVQRHGMQVLVPSAADREMVHRVIYEELCLGQVRASSRAQYQRVMADLVAQGAQAIILGCTEISLLIGAEDAPVPLFDTTAIHAQSAVAWALGPA